MDEFKNKFNDKGGKKIFTDFIAPKLKISIEKIDQISKKIDMKKSFGNDLIPFNILLYLEDQELIRAALEEAT